MSKPKHETSFSEQLLQQESSFQQTRYQEHRMNLEEQLNRLEIREKHVLSACKILLVITFILMFVGGSEVLGGFDPWNENANILSVTLGLLYLICAVSCPMLAAYYFSNLRPTTRRTRDDLLHYSIKELSLTVEQLGEEIAELKKNRNQH